VQTLGGPSNIALEGGCELEILHGVGKKRSAFDAAFANYFGLVFYRLWLTFVF